MHTWQQLAQHGGRVHLRCVLPLLPRVFCMPATGAGIFFAALVCARWLHPRACPPPCLSWHNIALDYLYKNLKAEQLAGHNFSRQQLKSVEKLGPILTSSTIN